MCEALRELMKDEIEAEKAKAAAEAAAEARAEAEAAVAEATAKAEAAVENTRRMNINNVRALIKSFGVSAEKAMDTLAIPQEARAELLAAL